MSRTFTLLLILTSLAVMVSARRTRKPKPPKEESLPPISMTESTPPPVPVPTPDTKKVATTDYITFNLTTAKCGIPEEENIFNPNNTFRIRSSTGKFDSCYDKDGIPYHYGTNVASCCNCFNYHCDRGYDRFGEYLYWSFSSISPSCCQDCMGVVFPPDRVMSIVTLEDECNTEEKSVCKHNTGWDWSMGVITKTYTPQTCCTAVEGLFPISSTQLDPKSCSVRTCREGQHWSTKPMFQGECDCCVFNDTLVPEGRMVELRKGLNATCCSGRMVVDYNITIPTDCSSSDAIHGSIGFAIDNTGSVSSSSKGVMALSNGLISQLSNFTIPKWVLVTFGDYQPYTSSSPPTEAEIALNTELRIVTEDVDMFNTSLNSIVFNGGGDSPERLTQGLLVTLTNLPKHGVALVFTDHQSKDLDMVDSLIQLRDEKEIKIFIVLAPSYYGTVGDPSWEAYSKLSQDRIYNMADFNVTQFLKEVVQVVAENCEGISLAEEVAEGYEESEESGEYEYEYYYHYVDKKENPNNQ